jgi:hypothetical protein
MDILTVLISAFIGLAAGFTISLLFFYFKKEKLIIEKERQKFEREKDNHKQHEEEMKTIIEEKSKEINDSYYKGFDEGYKRAEMNSKIISLQIKPWEETDIKREFFRKVSIKKIGYQYQLLVNGIPCLQPHVIIEKEVNLSVINEANIKEIIDKLKDSVDNAVNNIGGLVTFKGSFDNLKDSLIKQLPKRK